MISTSKTKTDKYSIRRDKQIRVFDFKKGKMKKVYDESVEVYQVFSSEIRLLDIIFSAFCIYDDRPVDAIAQKISVFFRFFEDF